MLDRPANQAIQIFQIARFAALLGASILLSKSGMDTHAIGSYETIMLIAGTFSFFWINGTTHTYLSGYKRAENKSAVTGALFGSIVVLSLLIALVLAVSRTWLLQAYAMEMDDRLFILFLLFFVVNNISFLTDYMLLAGDNGKGLIRLSIFQFFVQITAIALPAFLTHDVHWVVAGATLFMSIKSCISLYLVSRENALRIDIKAVRTFLQKASPLIVSFFLGGISIYVDGIIVSNFYDKATFATYQYGAREFPVSLLLANAFSAAMVSHISGNMQDVAAVRSGSLSLINKLFPVVIVLMAISYWIYPLVYNPQFQVSFLYFNIYLLLLISRLVFPHAILLGMGASKTILYAAIAEFILNIVISISLLQWIGLAGVAYGTVIAHISNKAILAWQLRKRGVYPAQYIPVRTLSIWSLVLLGTFVIFTYLLH